MREGSLVRVLGTSAAILVGSALLTSCSTARSSATSTPSAQVGIAGATRPSLAVARACAINHPASWMGCITSTDPGFANTELSEIAIPGAHDSGTFNLDATDFDKQSGSSCTSYIPLFSSVSALKFVTTTPA